MIDTSTRVFKAVVGPSGSGKTDLISKFLMGIFFHALQRDASGTVRKSFLSQY